MTDATVCIANIGPRERRRRVVFGAVMTAVTLAVVFWLFMAGVSRPLRVLVFLPAFMAALGYFQARAQTCVALAARGTMNMDDGDRAVGDGAVLVQMRQQSRQVLVQAASTAMLVTAVLLAF